MSRNGTLIKDDVRRWIDACRQKCRCHFANVMGELFRILPDGNGMKIDNAIETVVSFLQLNKITDSAQIVSQMQIARGLHA